MEKSVVRAAGIMGVATLISRVLGLVREQVFAIFFGASMAMDAFVVAYKIPNLFRDIFAEGAMNAAVVPTFVRVREQSGSARAWRLAAKIMRTIILFLGLLVIVGIFSAPYLVELYASAFRQVDGKFELTVLLTQMMFPFLLFASLAAAAMGFLNSSGSFFLPAFSSAVFNFFSIAVGLTASFIMPRWGWDPMAGMAFGVLVGGLLQYLCQMPSLKRLGFRWRADPSDTVPGFKDPELRNMAFLMVPVLISSGAVQINVLVNNILATQQQEGAVSWLNYAFRLFQFPIGVFGVSLAAATLPVISAYWANGDFIRVRHTLEKTLLSTFAVTLPATAGLWVLARPLIDVIYQYGKFTPEDAAQTALALTAYTGGICAYSLVKILVPACYALDLRRMPVYSSALSVALNLVFSLIGVRYFGFWGLALGTTLAVTFNALFLGMVLQNRLNKAHQGLSLTLLLRGFLRSFVCTLLMGCIVYLLWHWTDQALWSHLLSDEQQKVALWRALKILPMPVIGFLTYAALGYLFRSPEIVEIATLLKNKFNK